MPPGRLDEDLDRLVDAAPDDYARLLLIAEHIAALSAHLAYARQLRDACAARLRAHGMPVQRIAAAAGVGDSYLSRQTLALGVTQRCPGRRRRRPGH